MVRASVNVDTSSRLASARRRRSVRRRRAPARRYTRRRAARSNYRQSSNSTQRRRKGRTLTKYELVNLNPFDHRCNGVKIPDSNTQPSETLLDSNRFVLSSDSSNNARGYAFMPDLVSCSVASTGATTSTWTWGPTFGGSTNSSNVTSIRAEFTGLRPVGHGIRISSPLAPLNVIGNVHICIIPVELYSQTNWSFPTSISQMQNLPWYKQFTIAQLTQKSVTVVNKFLDCTATRYMDPDSSVASAGTNEFQFYNSWCAIIVAIEGAGVSVSALTVETVTHYEGLTKLGTTNDGTPAAEYDVRQLQDVSRIATTHPGVCVAGEEESLIAGAMRDLFNIAMSGGPGTSSYSSSMGNLRLT